MKYCLIGKTLSHSYSATLHRACGLEYDLVEVSPERVGDFVQARGYAGYNVTIPYKSTVIPYLDEVSPLAARAGAVNTVVVAEGRSKGYNTDYRGFAGALDYYGIAVEGKHALVLGSGGASKVVRLALEDRGARVTVVSRTGEVNYTNVYERQDVAIVVNATPVGTYPAVDEAPLDIARFAHLEFVYDLVYNPYRTQLIEDARRLGVRAQNGLAMLVIQALEAERLWTDKQYRDEDVDRLLRTLEGATLNIALMGMPSAGKSTVGKALAEALHKPFVDTDALIAEREGRTPRDIIVGDGEPRFRQIEAEAVREACSMRGAVIALGGGSVLREDNRSLIGKTAMVVYLTKDLAALTDDDRPTLQQAGAAALLRARAPIYLATKDVEVANDGTVEDAVRQIMNAYENFSA